jgi:hypothetical protein
MRLIARALAVLVSGSLLSLGAGALQEELRNDGFEAGLPVNFQAGFIEGEIGAARLMPTLACPCSLENVSLLLGGSADTVPIVLRVWDDPDGNVDPGSPLYVDSFSLTGSNNALQLIDLSAANVVVTGPFRVGIEFTHAGLPSIASDTDGTIAADENFILADVFPLGFFWFRSADLSVTGDWIIRATIDVPEPSAPALLISGAALLATLNHLRERRRRVSPTG